MERAGIVAAAAPDTQAKPMDAKVSTALRMSVLQQSTRWATVLVSQDWSSAIWCM